MADEPTPLMGPYEALRVIEVYVSVGLASDNPRAYDLVLREIQNVLAATLGMSEPDPNHEMIAARLTRLVNEFAQGLGLSEKTTWQIVDQVIADFPGAAEEKLLAEARDWMVLAASR
ncbi:hypothetical protein [Methylobacterium sp. J-070]|uniref:hypothetical protein n=1 Tax=Methylobacterium sp. J-070 TaxID=2836650 RepID=UPI001FB87BE8|nr:hypothetical protein [Methylobacterium sp. J-070]MCJ2053961.1 hypothetical protein [Methylobacterium sp. J-070]